MKDSQLARRLSEAESVSVAIGKPAGNGSCSAPNLGLQVHPESKKALCLVLRFFRIFFESALLGFRVHGETD